MTFGELKNIIKEVDIENKYLINDYEIQCYEDGFEVIGIEVNDKEKIVYIQTGD